MPGGSNGRAHAGSDVDRPEPVAVIGMGCRFPGGADSPEAFWRLLWSGVDAVGEIPVDRWDVERYHDPQPGREGAMYTRSGGFLPGMDLFDAAFFGISPREASRMDPQQRLLLQVAWEACEDAGLVPASLAGSDSGVFIGVSWSDYAILQYDEPATINAYTGLGGALSIAANRLSHFFDLRGPSMAVDTACSSSLVAVHLACQAIWRGETSLALAGGVNALLKPGPFIAFCQAGMLSPTGRCHSFDAAADGYVRSEGAGVVVLKPLGRALADGDPVQAVIVATGVNSDGRTPGVAQPSAGAQEGLLRHVYGRAGLRPEAVAYVEAHGTGTGVGDPVECEAVGRVLGGTGRAGGPLLIGSVKSNIGHLEPASGVAGLIKVVLCLRHRAVPGNLHLREPNPRIPFDRLGLRVAAESGALPPQRGPLHMGVNSFGFGGTNAHVVLREFGPVVAAPTAFAAGGGCGGGAAPNGTAGNGAVTSGAAGHGAVSNGAGGNGAHTSGAASNGAAAHGAAAHGDAAQGVAARGAAGEGDAGRDGEGGGEDPAGDAGRHRLLLLSARSPEALAALAAAHANHLRSAGSPPLEDICFTAAVRRGHHEHRLAAVAADRDDLALRLDEFASGGRPAGVVVARAASSPPPGVAVVFSGNGSQWPGMGADLLDAEPAFRRGVEAADGALRGLLGWSVVDLLRSRDRAADAFRRTEVAQPALFAVQVGLWDLWRSWGVPAQAALGHSVGEIAAAHAAGALDLGQAARVVHERSRLQAETAGRGRMAAVALGAEQAQAEVAAWGGDLAVAAVNGPGSVTLAGPADALEGLGARLRERGVRFHMLDLDYAFHSPAMEPIRRPLLGALAGLVPSRARLRLVSTVTGADVEGPELGPDYWWANVREAVQLAEAVDRLIADGCTTFLEIGPHPVLGGYLAECLRARGADGLVLGSLVRGQPGRAALLAGFGRAHAAGVALDMRGLFPAGGQCVPLPRYPWQGRRHWNAPREGLPGVAGRREHPLLGDRLPGAVPVWHGALAARAAPYLADHVVQGSVVFPAAGYVEMALAASRAAVGDGPCEIEGLAIARPLVLPDGGSVPVQTVVSPEDGRMRVFSRPGGDGGDWVEHASARLAVAARPAPAPVPIPPPAGLPGSGADGLGGSIDPSEHYRRALAHGLAYGPAFQVVRQLWETEGEVVGRLEVPAEAREGSAGLRLHPVLLDGCLQLAVGLAAAAGAGAGRQPRSYLPVRVERLRFHASPESVAYGRVRLQRTEPRAVVVDGWLLGESGEVLAEVEGCRLEALELPGGPSRKDLFHSFSWQAAPRADGEAPAAPALPEPRDLARRLRPRVRDLAEAHHRAEHYRVFRPRIEALCVSYVARALDSLGGGGPFTVDSLIGQHGVLAEHAAFLHRLMVRLSARRAIRSVEGGWVVDDGVLADPTPVWRDLLRSHPAYAAELTLVARCGERLVPVLRGEVDPLTLLFGERALPSVEHFYDTAPSMRIYNGIMQDAARALAAAWPGRRKLRVLEIGGGTGGTTAAVLPALPATACEYVFSDVSDAFLARAQARFGSHGAVRCQRLDIERTPDLEALGGPFDVVLAANVLHATADLRQTLHNVRTLLAPGGLLVLAENQAERWVDLMIFGTLPGWWRFRDAGLRSDSPLLKGSAWAALLRRCGFGEVASLTDAVPGVTPQLAVLLARAPEGAAATRAVAGSLEETAAGPWLDGTEPAPGDSEPVGVGLAVSAAPEDRQEGVREEGRTWLLVLNGGPGGAPLRDSAPLRAVGLDLADLLASRGHRVALAEAGGGYAHLAHGRYRFDPASAPDADRLVADLSADGLACEEIVHLAALGAVARGGDQGAADGGGPAPGAGRTGAMVRPPEDDCLSVVHLIQALMRGGLGSRPRLWLVTSGVHAVPGAVGAPDPAQATLWGLGRVLMTEHPELRCRLVDLQAGQAASDAALHLFAEMGAPDDEDEVVVGPGGRYVHRFAPWRGDGVPAGAAAGGAPAAGPAAACPPEAAGCAAAGNFRLVLGQRASLESLRLETVPRRAPGPGEVEVATRAVGLNFRDVALAAGLLGPEAFETGFAGGALGVECAGEVVAVGPGVGEFQVGDAVIACAGDAFSRFVTTSAQLAVHKPARLGWEEAATMVAAHLTARYGLCDLARLQPGERVLIHSGAGGVGLAAIQVARTVGAEVFATAGTPEKRDFLRLLGVEHVMDSRTLAFADEVLEASGGEGVDVVLNSLAGEAMVRGFSVLRPFGRFVEIGKRDIYEDARLGLRAFRHNVSYFAVSLDQLLASRPDLGGRLLREMVAAFERGEIEPLPFRAFPVSRSAEAFRHMQQSRHVGKIVVSLDDALAAPRRSSPGGLRCDPEGTYLITGGFGGLGLATAGWLVRRGARNLVLVGRSGAGTAEARAEVARLRAAGARVLEAAADVSREGEVEAVLARVRAELPPLRGVFHAAMVLDDGIVLRLDRERLHRVMAPKVQGAWHLHRLTASDPLEWFVCFASATTAVGNPGQGNYCASNAFLDALAEHRRAQGRPALTVSWGGISGVGYLARNDDVRVLLETRMGIRTITTAEAFDALERLLLAGVDRCLVADVDWAAWRRGHAAAQAPKYVALDGGGDAAESTARPGRSDLRAALAAAAPGERRPLVARHLAELAGSVLGLPPSAVDIAAPVTELGFDSLMSVELQDDIARDTGVEVPVMRILQGGSLDQLAAHVVQALGVPSEEAAPVAAVGAAGPAGRSDAPAAAGDRPARQPAPFDEAAPGAPETGARPVDGVRGAPRRRGSTGARRLGRSGADGLVVPLAPRAHPAVRLLTVPYLAGAAAVFRPWAEHLPPAVELLGVDLPGSQGRPADRPYGEMGALIGDLAQAIEPYLDGPLAIYGHSAGALVAYELALALRERLGRTPEHLMVAAYHPPDLPLPLTPIFGGWPRDIVERVSDAVLCDQLRDLLPAGFVRGSELLGRFLPAIRVQVALVGSYLWDRGEPGGTSAPVPVPCPLTCIGGAEDPLMTPTLLAGWERLTAGPFRHQTVPGGHLFIHGQRQDVLGVVREALAIPVHR